MDSSLVVPVSDQHDSVGEVFSRALPAAIATGMVAIGGLLISMQIQSARIEATITQIAKNLEELKIDVRAELNDLDRRVRALEMRR
jgi:hypothetical protein